MTYQPENRDPDHDIVGNADLERGTMVAIFAAVIIALGIGWYAFVDDRSMIVSTTPPSTVGQRVDPPMITPEVPPVTRTVR